MIVTSPPMPLSVQMKLKEKVLVVSHIPGWGQKILEGTALRSREQRQGQADWVVVLGCGTWGLQLDLGVTPTALTLPPAVEFWEEEIGRVRSLTPGPAPGHRPSPGEASPALPLPQPVVQVTLGPAGLGVWGQRGGQKSSDPGQSPTGNRGPHQPCLNCSTLQPQDAD